MSRAVRQAFIDTIPVLTGYLALGFGFGILLQLVDGNGSVLTVVGAGQLTHAHACINAGEEEDLPSCISFWPFWSPVLQLSRR